MDSTVTLRIVLIGSPSGVDFGLQSGSGTNYKTIQTARSKGKNLEFLAEVQVKDDRADGQPNFLGPLTQGPPSGRFIYIDIGTLAGQANTAWERRIKVQLSDIGWELIKTVAGNPSLVLEARLPGTSRDGGPACGTVQPIAGWSVVRARQSTAKKPPAKNATTLRRRK